MALEAAQVGTSLVEAAEAVAAMLAAPISSASDAESLELIAAIARLGRLTGAVAARAAGDVARRSPTGSDESLARIHGEKSAAALVAQTAHVDLGEATAWCSIGEAISSRSTLLGELVPPRAAAVGAALDAGTISLGAARQITSTVEALTPFAPVAELETVEAFLVEHAQHLTPRDLSRVCRALPNRYNPDGAEPREEELRARSGVTIKRMPDGSEKWILVVHPEASGFLHTAVDARTAPRRQPTFASDDEITDVDDDRTLAQRRLDALVSIARESLTNDSGRVAGTSVTMVVTIPLETLQSARGVAYIDGVDEPICAGTARRLAADADIIPMVLGGESEVLDLGRSQRLATAAQRRSVAYRDGGCIWPGCSAPPGWCELAHLVAWVLGGKTDVDNLAMMCPFHHHRFDTQGWRLTRVDGEHYLVPPPFIDPARTPRRAGKLPIAA